MSELESKALQILIENGAISPCDVHKDVYLDNGDPEAVSKSFADAAEMVKANQIETTKEKFTAAINSVIGEAVEDCPKCAEEEG